MADRPRPRMNDGDRSDGGAPPPYDVGLALTGAAELAEAAFRSSSRWFELMATRWPELSDLGQRAASPGDEHARLVLRDEVLGMMRDMAEISWQEMRAGIERFDAATRSDDAMPEPHRWVRTKN